MEILNREVHGVGIVPELSRHLTAKKGGHHILFRLRRRSDRKTVCYLGTDLYVSAEGFDPDTKQLFHEETNKRLVKLFGRAVAMLGEATGDDYKAAWERELVALDDEARLEKRGRVLDYFEHLNKEERHAALVAQRHERERELVALDEEIEALRLELNLPLPVATVTRAQRQEFQEMMTKFLTMRKNSLSERDYQMWTSWNKVLGEFGQSAGIELGFAAIDLDFYKRYKTFVMVTRGNTANTFGANVKRLKSFLKYAEAEGAVLNREAKSINFKIVEEKKKVVYLSDAELDMLWDYRFARPTVLKAIHLTLFQSLTGLRISDVAKSHTVVRRRDETSGELREYLTGTCKKNGGAYLIPLSLDPRIKEILIENSFNMKLLSEQVYNRDIKKILADMYALAGVPNEEIAIQRLNVKDKIDERTVLKSDLISTHSNRRSFISRHINSREFNQIDILKMLGSTDVKELQKYIDVDDVALNDKAKANARTRQAKAQRVKPKP